MELLVVPLRLGGVALDLLGTAIVAPVGIDGDQAHPVGRRGGEDDHRPTVEAADLDDLRPGSQRGRPVPEPAGLVTAHPSLDVVQLAEHLVERLRCARRHTTSAC